MEIVVVTGANGLIGYESCKFFADKGYQIVGIDNNMREYFFGHEGSTEHVKMKLQELLGSNYIHQNVDIRDWKKIENIFRKYNTDIKGIIHTAAQPSHDWATKEPLTDFTINANGTLNLLEATRQFCHDAPFAFTSSVKVYGNNPNKLPLTELDTRWEIDKDHRFYEGIDESMSIDNCDHSIFGASKVAADIMVQEYGRHYDMYTASFRGGCLTGPVHSAVELHGFLVYLAKCIMTGRRYNIFGWEGKQVRDNIHSCDVANAFCHFFLNPKKGEIYNLGGTRFSNCSLLEATSMIEDIVGKKGKFNYVEKPRISDYKWHIVSMSKFKKHYPNWHLTYKIEDIIFDIIKGLEKKV